MHTERCWLEDQLLKETKNVWKGKIREKVISVTLRHSSIPADNNYEEVLRNVWEIRIIKGPFRGSLRIPNFLLTCSCLPFLPQFSKIINNGENMNSCNYIAYPLNNDHSVFF